MQYMLLIYDTEEKWASTPENERNEVMREYFQFTDELRASGKHVAGNALQPTETSKSLRVRDGRTSTTDGPFAETKEQFGGYYLVDVDNEREALEWAAKIPSARFGTIEVRPVVVFPVEATA